MTLYCGIDLHGSNSVVAVLDEHDQTVYEKRLANDLATIVGVLRTYQAELAACAVESTYNWYWLDRLPIRLAVGWIKPSTGLRKNCSNRSRRGRIFSTAHRSEQYDALSPAYW